MIGIQAEIHAVVVAAEIEMRERGTGVENATLNTGVLSGRENGVMTLGAAVLLGVQVAAGAAVGVVPVVTRSGFLAAHPTEQRVPHVPGAEFLDLIFLPFQSQFGCRSYFTYLMWSSVSLY